MAEPLVPKEAFRFLDIIGFQEIGIVDAGGEV
jgi:hypothetical protein